VTGQSAEIIDAVKKISPSTPTCVVTNGVDPSRFGRERASEEARALIGTEPGPVFMYAGLLGLAQGLDQILDAAKNVSTARFVLVGDGPVRERLVARVASERITNVRILPAQPREKIPALLACADAAIVTLGMTIPGAVPSKIYEAMASALPTIIVATGEAASRVERAECGIAVRPDDVAGLTRAIVQLAGDPDLRARYGAAGRRAAETTYNRDRIADGLASFLRERVKNRSS
jgi:glycosyltransferase involved in cell wall biosynthesis